MGVRVSETGVGAFVALILAVFVIGIMLYARRRGHLQSRGALIAIAIVVGLLIAYGMTGGFLPTG